MATEQDEKEGMVSQLKENLVGMVPQSPQCFPKVSVECLAVSHTSEREDQMRNCPLNVAIWRLLVSLISGTGLDRMMGKEAGLIRA